MTKINHLRIIYLICFLLLAVIIYGFWRYYKSSLEWQLFDKKIETAFALNRKPKGNIAFVTWELSRTGLPIVLQRLAQMLKENNYNVAIFYKEKPSLSAELEAKGIPVIMASITLDTYDNYMKLLKNHFDLVIVCNDSMILEYSMISELMPTIWWLHETSPWSKFGLVADNISPESSAPAGFKQFVNPLQAYYFADIVTVSDYAAKSMKNYVKEPVKVIINGIYQEEIDESLQEGKSALYQQLEQAKKDKTMFITVGRVSSIKGQKVLIEAIKLLPQDYRDKAIFYIIGGVTDKVGSKLVKKNKNMQNVVFTGELNRQDLNDYYRAADVLLHPSIRDDAAPCVIVEAAMYHVPSVMTACSGSDYIVKDNDSGFIINPLDASALRDKIMWFIDNPEAIGRMGNRAYQNFLNTSKPEQFFLQWQQKIDSRLQQVRSNHAKQ